MIPEIVQVYPTKEYKVYVYFEDGKIVCYDVKPLLDKGVFSPLKDIDLFIDRCTIINGTLAWDMTGDRDPQRCIDIAPDTLYELSNVKEEMIA